MKVSVMVPVYLPSEKHRQMTEKCLYLAKTNTKVPVEWVIVETQSQYFINDADVYIHEKEKTNPNKSINKGFLLTSGQYVVFLANDVFVCEGWVEKMLACFEKKDCGLASLGTKEFGQSQEDRIIERLYFSVCMIPRRDAWLDPNYTTLFDDSDLAMRVMVRGKKCYQNLSGIVEHLGSATYGQRDLNDPESVRQRQYFKDKWEKYRDHPAYGLFA